MKIAIHDETSQQAELRGLEQAVRSAAHRAAENPEQSQARRERNAEFLACQRAAETPKQSQARRRRHAEYLLSQRAAETPEQSLDRQQQHADYLMAQRAAETPEQSQARRHQQATYMASQRTTETYEMAESRRRTVAERAEHRHQTFTRNTWGVFSKAAFEYDETHKHIKIEAMSIDCKYCGALKWKEEAAGMCCSGGKVAIPSIDEPVQPLKELFCNETDISRRFLKNIRKYNMCFHMTSFGADKIVSMPGFRPTFTIQGQVYHRIGSLIPTAILQPQFLQVYFIGNEQSQIVRRTEYVQCVDKNIDKN